MMGLDRCAYLAMALGVGWNGLKHVQLRSQSQVSCLEQFVELLSDNYAHSM